MSGYGPRDNRVGWLPPGALPGPVELVWGSPPPGYHAPAVSFDGSDRFAHVKAFREAGAVNPGDAVAYLESGVFDRGGESVAGAGAAEGEEVAAGFEDAEAFGGP